MKSQSKQEPLRGSQTCALRALMEERPEEDDGSAGCPAIPCLCDAERDDRYRPGWD